MKRSKGADQSSRARQEKETRRNLKQELLLQVTGPMLAMLVDTISRTRHVAVEAVRRTTKTYNTHARSTRRSPVPKTTWPGLYLHNIALKLNLTLRSNQPISYMQA